MTETEWTFDKKCYTVYKVQCSDGYDTGKVMNPFPPHLVFMEGSLQKHDASLLPVPGFGSSVTAQRGLHLVKKTWLGAVSEDVTARDNPSHEGNDILVRHYASSVS